jgi:hypothetical protein
VPDFFPTMLDLFGQTYPQPSWSLDGESILSLLRGNTSFVRSKPLAWRLHDQVALMDPTGQYKLVKNPDKGLCDLENSTYLPNMKTGPFLFDLLADPTESSPITTNPSLYNAMVSQMNAWEASIAISQVYESGCLPGNSSGSAVTLRRNGKCLGVESATNHAVMSGDDACPNRKGDQNDEDDATAAAGGSGSGSSSAAPPLTVWIVDATANNLVRLASNSSNCFHADLAAKDPCAAGVQVWLGDQCEYGMQFDSNTGTLTQPSCDGMCAGVSKSSGNLVLASCNDASTTGWAAQNATLAWTGEHFVGDVVVGWDASRGGRGVYLHPLD